MTPQEITKKHGTSYYLASLLFPKDLREATWDLYAFFRLADEIVDNPPPGVDPHVALDEYATQWRNDADRTCFLHAMRMDLDVARYETYDDLRGYMDGSAMVVGRMMAKLIGSAGDALPYAEALGEAMQLTNFLRDVGEDFQARGRIYLPQEDLRRFGLTDADVEKKIVTDAWRAFMKFEIERARALYVKADVGIPMLAKRGQRAVRIARVFYAAILEEIEKNDFEVFTKRARVSSFKKLRLLVCAW